MLKAAVMREMTYEKHLTHFASILLWLVMFKLTPSCNVFGAAVLSNNGAQAQKREMGAGKE